MARPNPRSAHMRLRQASVVVGRLLIEGELADSSLFLCIPDTLSSHCHIPKKMTKLLPYLREARCAYAYQIEKATYQLMHPPLVYQIGKMALVIQPPSLSGVTVFTFCILLRYPSYLVNLLDCRCTAEGGCCRREVGTTSSTAPSV